jgi:ABC-type sugar transport system ATPase subunit
VSQPARPPDPPLLELRGIRKRFGGVKALDAVNFDLHAGEIHALLGINGAGKSTLIKVLGGIHRPDAGTILLDDRPVLIRDVPDADRSGIRIIHQELSLAPDLSVAENLFLGREPVRFGLIDRRRMIRDAQALVRTLGLDEIQEVRRRVSELSVAHQQLVEIARALNGQARILVLDEPTSALSEAETAALFTTLQRLRGQGVGIIYISHRLSEIRRLADRITVLRDGRSIGTRPAAQVDPLELVRWMVGRELDGLALRPAQRPGQVALEVRGLRNAAVHDVSFRVHQGEVLGLAGLVGSGRSELVRALFGIDRYEAGELLVEDRPVAITCPADALRAGIVLVPEDRKRQGLIMTHSTAFNAALPWVADWIRWCWPRWHRRRAIVERVIRSFGVQAADPEQPIHQLSGGNQQKVLVGRWMEHRPKVLILDEPTRGVDVAARQEMFQFIRGFVESGMAVVLISSDLSEVLSLAHRVLVYHDGRVLHAADAADLAQEAVLAQLTGANAHAD